MKIRDTVFIKSAVKPAHYPDLGMPEVAFAGRSNVGKSSLINTLVNRRGLVKVSRTPGRTQHINFFRCEFADDRQLSLVDLPGYGFAKVPQAIKAAWGVMMESYLAQRRELKAVVIVMDIRRGVTPDDRQMIEAMAHFGAQPILVFTKSDKFSRNKRLNRLRQIAREEGLNHRDMVAFSSLENLGIEDLWKRIEEVCLPRLRPMTFDDAPDEAAQAPAGAAPEAGAPPEASNEESPTPEPDQPAPDKAALAAEDGAGGEGA